MMKIANIKAPDGKTLGKLALSVLLGLGVYSYLQERSVPTQTDHAPLFAHQTSQAQKGFTLSSSTSFQNADSGWGMVPHSNMEQPVGGPHSIAPRFQDRGAIGGQGTYSSSESSDTSAPAGGGWSSGDTDSCAQDDGYEACVQVAPTNSVPSNEGYADPSSNPALANYDSSPSAVESNFDPAAGVSPTPYNKYNDPEYLKTQEEQHIGMGDILGGTTTYKDSTGNYVQTDGSNGAAYQDPNSGNVATFESQYGAPDAGSSYSEPLTPLGAGPSDAGTSSNTE